MREFIMDRIILGAMLVMLAISGTGLCDMAKIPACADLYVNLKSLGTYNSEALRCDTGMGNVTNVTAVQFNISGLNLLDSDIVLLTLRATSMRAAGDTKNTPNYEAYNTSNNSATNTPTNVYSNASSNAAENGSKDLAGLAAVPISSTWSEFSGTNGLMMSLLPSIEVLLSHGIDLSQVGISLSDEGARSFDVTRDVRESRARGEDRISFLLGSFSSGEYRSEFQSRETGQGPYILIISYPKEDQSEESPGAQLGSKAVSSQEMPTPFSVRMKESSPLNRQGAMGNSSSIAAIKQREVQKSLDFMAAKVSDSMPSRADVQPESTRHDNLQIGLNL